MTHLPLPPDDVERAVAVKVIVGACVVEVVDVGGSVTVVDGPAVVDVEATMLPSVTGVPMCACLSS